MYVGFHYSRKALLPNILSALFLTLLLAMTAQRYQMQLHKETLKATKRKKKIKKK